MISSKKKKNQRKRAHTVSPNVGVNRFELEASVDRNRTCGKRAPKYYNDSLKWTLNTELVYSTVIIVITALRWGPIRCEIRGKCFV